MNPHQSPQTSNENTQDSTQKQREVLTPKRISQKSFTSEPKIYRIRRGHTIVIRRCQDIMKHLWQMGLRHRAIVTKDVLEGAIFYCAGGDYRTVRKYTGFDIVLEPSKALKHIPGYLEKLRYADRIGGGKYYLRHTAVPLPYHYSEKFYPPSPRPKSMNVQQSNPVLCVRSGSGGSVVSEGAFDVAEDNVPTTKLNKKQNNNTHTNQLSKSKLCDNERRLIRVLDSSVKEGC
jgi:hypothetical protein